MKERRIGKFYVSNDRMDDEDLPTILSELKFVPYRVEHLFYRGEFEYIGTSSLFRPLIMGREIPIYRIIANKQEDGTIKVGVERQ